MLLSAYASAALLVSASLGTALADDETGSSTLLNSLLACQTQQDDQARLQCQDTYLAQLAAAQESGQIVVVERQVVREVQRDTFGLSAPSFSRIGAFLRRGGGDENTPEPQEETVEFEDGGQATYAANGRLSELSGLAVERTRMVQGKLEVTLANGQVWRQTDTTRIAPIRARHWEAGITAEITSGALGSYFMKLDPVTMRFRARRLR